MKQISLESSNRYDFLVIICIRTQKINVLLFARTHTHSILKLELEKTKKVGKSFSHFLPSVDGNRKQFQCLNISIK